MKRAMILAAAVVMMALAAFGVSCGDDDEKKDGATIDVTLSDFKVKPSSDTATAGKITFNVKNDGPTQHEFVILKTSRPAGSLPVEDDVVPEDADGIEVVDEVEDLDKGDSGSVTVDLDEGSYVLVCNVATHYKQGMYVAFTATAP